MYQTVKDERKKEECIENCILLLRKLRVNGNGKCYIAMTHLMLYIQAEETNPDSATVRIQFCSNKQKLINKTNSSKYK